MRTRLGATALAALLAATVVGGAPSPAGAHTLSAQHLASCSTQRLPLTKGQPVHVTADLAGAVATLRGTSGHAYFGTPRVLQPRLTVTAANHVVSTFRVKPVVDTPGSGVLLDGVDAPGAGRPVLCVAHFPAGPVALVGTTSAFNQCCFLIDTYAKGVRTRSPLQDGLLQARLRVINKAAALVTADGSFLARFTDYADSAAPLRILTVRTGQQRDITNSYRARLRSEASEWWKQFGKRPQHGLGFLAAWAADQERLGNDSTVWSKLHELDDAGKLDGMTGWPRNQAYIAALKKFLTSRGYR